MHLTDITDRERDDEMRRIKALLDDTNKNIGDQIMKINMRREVKNIGDIMNARSSTLPKLCISEHSPPNVVHDDQHGFQCGETLRVGEGKEIWLFSVYLINNCILL